MCRHRHCVSRPGLDIVAFSHEGTPKEASDALASERLLSQVPYGNGSKLGPTAAVWRRCCQLPHPQMTQPDRLTEKTRERCVGTLNDEAVYFVGTRTSFHLAIECSPGLFRRLSEAEHRRFKQQSRVEGIHYGEYWE